MQPTWILSETVSLSTTFSLTESFALASDADAFIWSDFLGTPSAWLPRRVDLAGRLTLDQQLAGRLTEDQPIAGRLSLDQEIEGDI